MVRAHQIYAEKKEALYALAEVRQRVLAMVERMCRGEVQVIKPCTPNREQKKFVYKTVGVSENHLVLPTIGTIAMKQHRDLSKGCAHCFAVVVMDHYGANYYVDLVVRFMAFVPEPELVRCDSMLGSDYTQDGLFVMHTNENGSDLGFRQQSKQKLERCYRAAKRFRPGSRRRYKYMRRAAKLEWHIINQRLDWQYKKAHQPARKYGAVGVETLNWKKMRQDNSEPLPKANDNAGSQFYRILKAVFELAGKLFVEVERYFPSSQICSCCGYKIGKLPLGQEVIHCLHCGMTMDHNHNAACNVHDAAQLENALLLAERRCIKNDIIMDFFVRRST